MGEFQRKHGWGGVLLAMAAIVDDRGIRPGNDRDDFR